MEFGPLHYRHLEKDKVQALSASKGNYQGRVQLSRRSRNELQWWIDNIALSNKYITHEKPSFTIQSDASTVGWGAALSGQSTVMLLSLVTAQRGQSIHMLDISGMTLTESSCTFILHLYIYLSN